jgi:spoIIIJ-associated protein
VEESIRFAKKYMEDLLSFFGLNTDVYATSEDGEVIEINVPSTHMNGFLIGNSGDTMRSLQYLTSMALRTKGFELNRVNVDIADYKKQRAERLEVKAQAWLDDVKESGKERHLPAMNAADRRTIHKLAEEHGLTTESIGFGRDRHVVLKPLIADIDETKEKQEDKDTKKEIAEDKKTTLKEDQ